MMKIIDLSFSLIYSIGCVTCSRIFKTAVNLPCSHWKDCCSALQQMEEQMLKF